MGSGARPGHSAFCYKDGEMEHGEKPAGEEGLYPSLSVSLLSGMGSWREGEEWPGKGFGGDT